MSYAIERALLDSWASWVRRNKYHGAPRRPRNSIGAIMDLGIPTGPVHYGDEIVDSDREAERVNHFMGALKSTNARVHAALTARHVREFTDARGKRWIRSQLPERKMAMAMYGASIDGAQKMLQRDCDAGYSMLRNFIHASAATDAVGFC